MSGGELIDYRNRNGFPPTVCIELLKWCNLQCPFCRSASTSHDRRQLSLQQIERLIDSIARFGPWRFALTGGEPFAWQHLDELLALLSSMEMPFSVTTNGTASEGFLKRTPSNLWATGTLYVSIDGDRATHDSFRGMGNFEKSRAFLKSARQHVPKLFVGTVLVTDSSLWLEDMAELLSECQVDNWTLISPVRSGRWDGLLDLTAHEIPFARQFQNAKDYMAARGIRTTVSFLDFAASDNHYHAAVYVTADGLVKLPGFLPGSPLLIPGAPVTKTVLLDSPDLPIAISQTVRAFIAAQGFML